MNKKLYFLLMSIALVGAHFPAGAAAHGAYCTIVKGVAAVRAEYDHDSPMAFCDVRLFSPDPGDSVYSAGSTDSAGRFVFFPARAGSWKVEVDDGMGHVATAELNISEDMTAEEMGSGGPGRLYGSITGISVIFGLFGLYAIFRRKSHGR